jgi:preprotein translocase subunit SecA
MLAHHLVAGGEGLYDPQNMPLLHHVNQALRAHTLFHLDVEYMVKDGQVVIVDEFTGRLMPGRRWSDGLHQAVEAKEHNGQHPEVKIERENQTLATITFQNYFRKYGKLSGMTGTADTEAQEFASTYKIDVMVIPTNRVLRRVEEPDTVYRTEREKYDAIVNDILDKQKLGRPVLVGTVSIEKSEKLSRLLKLRGIKHVVLNAKYHAQEAEIVAQAGRKATVTIATNMAGRGTDILLGGNPEFMARQQALAEEIGERLPKGQEKFVDDAEFVYFFHLDNFYRVPRPQYEQILNHYRKQTDVEHEEVVSVGGLHIIATERHEARRIDNQLRGRAGRQGDPGSSRFYLSLEDDLMRIFGSDRISGLMQRLGMEEGVPIEHNMVTKAIERAQKQVEAQNFAVRKHLLEYDDVMNKQRESIYSLRRELLEGHVRYTEEDTLDIRGYLHGLAEDLAANTVATYASNDTDPESWDLDALAKAVTDVFGFEPAEQEQLEFGGLSADQMTDLVWKLALEKYENKEKLLAEPDILHRVERDIMLQIVDSQWKDHLYSLDHLKEGIGLRGYGQRDPLVEYKKESYELFTAMRERIEDEIVRYLWRLMPVSGEGMEGTAVPTRPQPRRPAPSQMTLHSPSAAPASPFGAIRGGGAPSAAPRSGGQSPRPARTGGDDVVKQVKREEPKVGRNEPCPCGSGKKYKKCHGAAA